MQTDQLLRGGSWYNFPVGCRSAFRLDFWRERRLCDFGSRLVIKEKKMIKSLRGGSWFSLPENCRSAYRAYNDRNDRYEVFGFRLTIKEKKNEI